MTLPEVNSLYSTDERCRELLAKLRWPMGVECLRCKNKKVYDLAQAAPTPPGEVRRSNAVTRFCLAGQLAEVPY